MDHDVDKIKLLRSVVVDSDYNKILTVWYIICIYNVSSCGRVERLYGLHFISAFPFFCYFKTFASLRCLI